MEIDNVTYTHDIYICIRCSHGQLKVKTNKSRLIIHWCLIGKQRISYLYWIQPVNPLLYIKKIGKSSNFDNEARWDNKSVAFAYTLLHHCTQHTHTQNSYHTEVIYTFSDEPILINIDSEPQPKRSVHLYVWPLSPMFNTNNIKLLFKTL